MAPSPYFFVSWEDSRNVVRSSKAFEDLAEAVVFAENNPTSTERIIEDV